MPIVPYAPSWLWASIVGPVRYIDRHLDQFRYRRSGDDEVKPVLQVLRAATVPQTADVYGPVTAGFVTIRGQVLDVMYNLLGGTWRPVLPGRPPGNDEAIAGLFRRFVMLRAATYIWDGTMSTQRTEVVALLLARVDVDRGDGFQEVCRRQGVVLHAFDSDKVWNGVEVKTIIIT
ncbi:hypothetical protein N657DRAFT_312643 [Parathielavia appendiculata]|uniref:Uncharacterized protein n=1 Tax=Parathielavia appendiculata TaxID=2587402 RepID=A0AAN6U5W6_9PEZI|nr:hypothetical protein N657DRAFT_312643 [Parathielavia appendiculata]